MMAMNGGLLGGNGNGNGNGTGMKKGSVTPGEEKHSTEPPGILRDPSIAQARRWNTDIPNILPHERVFPIQIGTELFRLSGASISSDGMCLALSPSWIKARERR